MPNYQDISSDRYASNVTDLEEAANIADKYSQILDEINSHNITDKKVIDHVFAKYRKSQNIKDDPILDALQDIIGFVGDRYASGILFSLTENKARDMLSDRGSIGRLTSNQLGTLCEMINPIIENFSKIPSSSPNRPEPPDLIVNSLPIR